MHPDGAYEATLPAPGDYAIDIRAWDGEMRYERRIAIPDVPAFALDLTIDIGFVSGRVIDDLAIPRH